MAEQLRANIHDCRQNFHLHLNPPLAFLFRCLADFDNCLVLFCCLLSAWHVTPVSSTLRQLQETLLGSLVGSQRTSWLFCAWRISSIGPGSSICRSTNVSLPQDSPSSSDTPGKNWSWSRKDGVEEAEEDFERCALRQARFWHRLSMSDCLPKKIHKRKQRPAT